MIDAERIKRRAIELINHSRTHRMSTSGPKVHSQAPQLDHLGGVLDAVIEALVEAVNGPAIVDAAVEDTGTGPIIRPDEGSL